MMVTIFIARQILSPAPYGLDILTVGALGLAAYLGCQLVLGLEPSEKALLGDLIKRITAQSSGVADTKPSH
jgi:hypothetical protein